MSKQLWDKWLLGLNILPLIHSAEELLLERKLKSHILCLHISHFALVRERKGVSGRQKWDWKISRILESDIKIALLSQSLPGPGCSRGRSSSCFKALWSPQEHVFDTQQWKCKAMNSVEVQFVHFLCSYFRKKKKKSNIFILIKPWICQMRLSGGNLYLCVLQHWQSCLFLNV